MDELQTSKAVCKVVLEETYPAMQRRRWKWVKSWRSSYRTRQFCSPSCKNNSWVQLHWRLNFRDLRKCVMVVVPSFTKCQETEKVAVCWRVVPKEDIRPWVTLITKFVAIVVMLESNTHALVAKCQPTCHMDACRACGQTNWWPSWRAARAHIGQCWSSWMHRNLRPTTTRNRRLVQWRLRRLPQPCRFCWLNKAVN